ncbi:MAG TPA: amidohydrolase [Nitrososphaerales archaeon]|nr:amidohydrolase [Nitrososphaerales archaeon]
MAASIKIENASWIVTVDKNRRLLKDASIVIDDKGRIAQVGKAKDLRGEPAEFIIDAKDTVVTPGFINCHMHISYSHPIRGIFPDDMPQQAYLQLVFQLQKAMTPDEEYYTSLLAMAELLRNGCTTILDPGTAKSLPKMLSAIEKSGIRAIVGKSFANKENPLSMAVTDASTAARETERVIEEFNGALNGRVTAWAMPFSPEYCTDEAIRKVEEIASARKVGTTMHVANSEQACETFRKATGLRPIEFLARQRLLSENTLLAHCVSVNDSELDALKTNRSKVVFCPPVAVRGTGITKTGKFPEMIARGIPVGIGNDAANSSYYLDPIRAMYLASVLFKEARQDRRMIPPESAVEMATINGAKCLLQDDDIGSLEPGKKADIVLHDTRRPEWRSLFNPLNNLVYSADGRGVRDVIVDGNVIVRSGRIISFNDEELYDKLQAVGEDILQRTGIHFDSRWPVF